MKGMAGCGVTMTFKLARLCQGPYGNLRNVYGCGTLGIVHVCWAASCSKLLWEPASLACVCACV